MSIVHSEALPYLASLPDASVDLFVLDPPYGIGKSVWDKFPTATAYLAWLRPHLDALRRVLAPTGSLYLFAAPQLAARVEVLVGEVFHVLNQIVWVKEQGWYKKAEKEACRAYLSNTERIIFAEQSHSDTHAMDEAGYDAAVDALHKQVFAPLGSYIQHERERAGMTRDQVDVALGYVRTKDPTRGTELCRRWEEGSSLPTADTYDRLRHVLNTCNGHSDYLQREHDHLRREYEDLRREHEDLRQEYEDLRRPFAVTANGYETEVWRFAVVPPGHDRHLCEKPLPLLKHVIATSSRPGAVVCDPFCGSGSTLDAARQLNRRYQGCDSDPVWVRRAQQRLASPYTLELFAEPEGARIP